MANKPTVRGRKSPPSAAQLKCPIEEYIAQQADEAGEDAEADGKIFRILRLWRAGYSRAEIATVFNRVTVYRQIGEYEKLRKAPAMSMYGLELYEARVLRMMKRRKCSREDAVTRLAELDIDAED